MGGHRQNARIGILYVDVLGCGKQGNSVSKSMIIDDLLQLAAILSISDDTQLPSSFVVDSSPDMQ
ncbi:hypothetical protein D3C71_1894210 [compost metagenome]